jgi:hypothetical protein
MHMAYAGDVETLAALARTGASLDYVSNDGTLNTLIGAVTNGHGAAVDFLVGQGLDPDALTPSGNSAIVVAAARNNLALVQRLLAAGADPNRGRLQDGTSALHHAAIHNNRAMIDALLNAGARPGPDGSGHAPGYYAFWLHQDENLAVRLGYGDARGYAERERRRNEPGFDWAEFARRMQPALEQTMGEIQTAQSQYNAGVAAANSNYDQAMAQAFRDAERLGQPLNALGNPPPYATPSDAGLPSPYAAQQSSRDPNVPSFDGIEAGNTPGRQGQDLPDCGGGLAGRQEMFMDFADGRASREILALSMCVYNPGPHELRYEVPITLCGRRYYASPVHDRRLIGAVQDGGILRARIGGSLSNPDMDCTP